MDRKWIKWTLLVLAVIGLSLAACAPSLPEMRDPFSARSKSEAGTVVEWSGYTEGYQPEHQEGQHYEVQLSFENRSDEQWQAKYCIQLLDRRDVVATLGQREFALDAGASMGTPHVLRLPEGLSEGAYGLALVVHRPQGSAVNTVAIQIGETDETYRPQQSADQAALAACPPPVRAPASGAADLSPEEVARAFYDAYIDYAQFDPERGRRNPLVDGVHRSSPYLSEAFVQKLDETLASFQRQTEPGGGYDPVLCAQDVPESISVSPATISSEGRASAVVETSFGDHSFTVELERIDGRWVIADVLCSREGALGPQVERLVETAKARLAERLGIGADRVQIRDVRETQFPDASLGVPEPGKAYAQVVTLGYVIELAAEGRVVTYHASGERVVAVPDGEGQPPNDRITVQGVKVTTAQVVVRGVSTLPDGTCLNTELWADGAPLAWWPTDTCAPIQQSAWELAVPLGEGQALQPGVQYMLRAYQPGGPNIVSTFSFDLDSPPKPPS